MTGRRIWEMMNRTGNVCKYSTGRVQEYILKYFSVTVNIQMINTNHQYGIQDVTLCHIVNYQGGVAGSEKYCAMILRLRHSPLHLLILK